MERLTSYKNDLEREMICRYEECDTVEEYCPHLNKANCPCLQEVLNKLAEYEDLEEQGLLLKLPCKVGDKVYQADSAGTIFESVITKIIYDTNGIAFDESAIGKTVFLTEQEAQAALEKMKAGEVNES